METKDNRYKFNQNLLKISHNGDIESAKKGVGNQKSRYTFHNIDIDFKKNFSISFHSVHHIRLITIYG